ncbi:hypothetical protein MUP35_01625 [Patescibacteria group bacterium]|nr:hypothetical protein [Patescibacteria group bacterium]
MSARKKLLTFSLIGVLLWNGILLVLPAFALEENASGSAINERIATESAVGLATSSGEFSLFLPATDSAEPSPTTDEAIGETIIEEVTEEPEVNEESAGEQMIQLAEPLLPPKPPLKKRKLNKSVKIEKNANYNCSVEPFRVNLVNANQALVKLRFQNPEIESEIEIGSLPLGIDVVIAKNKDYLYQPQLNEQVLNLEITKQEGAQEGSFSIPILYSKNKNSTIICQINVIN